MAFESSKVHSIRKALKKRYKRDIKFIKIHGNEFTEAGTPDIIGCYKSICFVMECKNERGKTSRIQRVRLRQWARAGAFTAIPRSAQDAIALIEEIKECLT